MAAPYTTTDNPITTGSAREGLLDFITNISPKDRPFTAGLQVRHDAFDKVEWLTDVLATRGSKATIQGADTSYSDITKPVRETNNMEQIEVTWSIADANNATTHAGMSSLMAHEIAQQSANWANSLEYDAIQSTEVAFSEASTAAKMGGVEAFITTVDQAAGDNPLDEKALGDIGSAVYDEGGNPTEIYVKNWLKRKISSFGTNVKNVQAIDKRLINAVDIYIDDFGQKMVFISRDVTAGTLLLIDPKLWALSYLIDAPKEDQAKTGSATNGVIIGNVTLISKQEKGN